jgi:DnaJ-class molecular chaperone
MGKGSSPRPFSVERDTFAANFDRTFSARRELTARIHPDRCPACDGDGRADHPKNACPECGGNGKRKEAA